MHSWSQCLSSLQNNIREYYTMIQWIAQPIFEDPHQFEQSFIEPITRGGLQTSC